MHSHPYLFFNREDLQQLRSKIEYPLMKRKWERLLECCEQAMRDEIIREPIIEHPQLNDDSYYQFAFWSIRKRMELLAFVGLLTENKAYLAKAKAQLLNVAGWKHWYCIDAQGKHQPTIGAAMLAMTCAIGYDWLYDLLTEDERRLVRKAMIEKGARPICKKYLVDDPLEMPGPEINWPVAWFAGVGLVGLSLYYEDPEAKVWVHHAENIMREIVCWGNPRDGGWHEGITYLFFSLSNILPLIEALRRITAVDLYSSPLLRNTLDFILFCTYPTEKSLWVVNFNDCAREDYFPEPLGGGERPDQMGYPRAIMGPAVLRLASQYRDGRGMWLYEQYLEKGDPEHRYYSQ